MNIRVSIFLILSIIISTESRATASTIIPLSIEGQESSVLFIKAEAPSHLYVWIDGKDHHTVLLNQNETVKLEAKEEFYLSEIFRKPVKVRLSLDGQDVGLFENVSPESKREIFPPSKTILTATSRVARLRDRLLLIARSDEKTDFEKKVEMIKTIMLSNIVAGYLPLEDILEDLTSRLNSPTPVKLFSPSFYKAKYQLRWNCAEKMSSEDAYELLFPIAMENIPNTQKEHEMTFFLAIFKGRCKRGLMPEVVARIMKYLNNVQCETEWKNRHKNQISGAFGMILGCKFDPNFAAEKGSLTDGTPLYRFLPKKPFRSFGEYYVMITPKTNQIYKIWARGSLESSGRGRKERDLIFSLLEKKYGKQKKDNIFDPFPSSKYIVEGDKQIEVRVNNSFSDSTIEIKYVDTRLESLAEEERLKLESSNVDDSGF